MDTQEGDGQACVFPKGFVWGAATAAYQIEGAWDSEGKGPSIWDDFVRQPKRIEGGHRGDVACDHYHRVAQDVALMREIGLHAYRFSVSWPRVFPEGRGRINEAGLDYYSRLVDTLLEAGVDPYLTLYHWDLPSALHREGGWHKRSTVDAFGEYAACLGRRLGDRVKNWMTLNEPLIFWLFGYQTGEHAPGERSWFPPLDVAHHIMLAHGVAMAQLRAVCSGAKVGIVNNLSPVYPERSCDEPSLPWAEDWGMRLFMDPLFKKHYPSRVEPWLKVFGRGAVRPGDLDIIGQPMDFLGLNHYTRIVFRRTWNPVTRFRPTIPDPDRVPTTAMGWEIYPDGFRDLLLWIKKEYGSIPIFITENGVACKDMYVNDRVTDPDRVDFLKRYLGALHEAMQQGVDVRGYFLWSFLDNFEWAFGYFKRFGVVYVDYESQRRIIKDSGRWYGQVCRTNVVS